MPETPVFKNPCTCGGFAHSMNGRPAEQPHMNYCKQRDEYAEWWAAQSWKRSQYSNDETYR